MHFLLLWATIAVLSNPQVWQDRHIPSFSFFNGRKYIENVHVRVEQVFLISTRTTPTYLVLYIVAFLAFILLLCTCVNFVCRQHMKWLIFCMREHQTRYLQSVSHLQDSRPGNQQTFCTSLAIYVWERTTAISLDKGLLYFSLLIKRWNSQVVICPSHSPQINWLEHKTYDFKSFNFQPQWSLYILPV